MALYTEYLTILCVVLGLTFLKKLRGGSDDSSKDSKSDDGNNTHAEQEQLDAEQAKNFSGFQKQFLFVYLIMMAADWLQGPYVYELYAHYGFSRADNGILFIAGFGSSLVFGTWAGPLADRYGRKLCCLLYGVSYTLSCFTKHIPNFQVLMVGRLLGGFATSILWSAFESWMVSEHINRKFPKKDVEQTFGLMFMWNGLVAIASGFLAQIVVAVFKHPVAPFDLSALFLISGSIFIYFSWPENYGDESVPMIQQFSEAYSAIRKDKNVFFVGLMQALFEGAMYTFVFLWTPALSTKEGETIPHGLIFSSFMTASSLGGSLFGFLVKRGSLKSIMPKIFAAAVACMSVPVFSSNEDLIMLAFILFEVVVGVFWPTIGSLRAEYVPENCRATVTNVFRIPLNLIVCVVLFMQSEITVAITFLVCCALHGAGLFVASSFSAMSSNNALVAGVSGEELETIAQSNN
jgi:MFS transporter, MFS domain-containing protein family, molybdate-anion transporter